jgi:hypothetical protein
MKAEKESKVFVRSNFAELEKCGCDICPVLANAVLVKCYSVQDITQVRVSSEPRCCCIFPSLAREKEAALRLSGRGTTIDGEYQHIRRYKHLWRSET